MEELRATPDSERALFVLLGYAANEFNFFSKLMIFSTSRVSKPLLIRRNAQLPRSGLARGRRAASARGGKTTRHRQLPVKRLAGEALPEENHMIDSFSTTRRFP